MGLYNKSINNEINEYNDVPDYMGYCPNCPSCGSVMGYSYSKSEFKCFDCGNIVDENDLDIDDPDDMPWGCVTCGGPYPACTTSCKMFDE